MKRRKTTRAGRLVWDIAYTVPRAERQQRGAQAYPRGDERSTIDAHQLQ